MLKIAIAEDQSIMRNGLAQLFREEQSFEILHLVENGKILIDAIETTKLIPDVILMDIEMPVMNGFEATKIIKKKYPKVQILFLTTHKGSSFIENAISKGASGYISKDEEIDVVIEAIREVHDKGYFFNENISFQSIQQFMATGKIKPLHLKEEILGAKEIEFTIQMCYEKTDREIAEIMNLSVNTALTYRKNIMKKLGTNKSIGVVIWAIKNKIVSF